MRRRPTPASGHSPGACGGAGVPLLRRLSAAAPQLGKLNGTRLAERASRRGNDVGVSPDCGGSPVFEDFVDPLDLCGDLPGVARAYVGLHDKRDSRRSLGDDVDASLDHRHDLVPFAFERGEHGRGFVRQARLADRLDRGRNRLGHGAVGLIGRHRRNGECKQHRARLALASAKAQTRGRKSLTVGPGERGSARAAERLRIVKPGQPPRVWRRVCIGALGVDAPRRAAGFSFQSSSIGVGPQTASVRKRRRSAIGVGPLQVSVSDRSVSHRHRTGLLLSNKKLTILSFSVKMVVKGIEGTEETKAS